MTTSGEFASVWRRHECEPPEADDSVVEQAKARVSNTVVAFWKCPTCGSAWEFANWWTVGHTSCWWKRASVRMMPPTRPKRKRSWLRRALSGGSGT